jgi:biopolymer transport protein ExbD
MELARSRHTRRDIDLTPLIDIVFLLIVFFMLTSSFVKTESLEMTVGALGNLPAATPSNTLTFVLDARGAIQHGGKPLSPSALERQVRNAVLHDLNTPMLLVSTKGVTVQQVVTAMDRLYRYGARHVSLAHAESP